MGQQIVGRRDLHRAEVLHGPLHVDRVSVDDHRNHQVEARGTEALVKQGTIGDSALTLGMDGVDLALIETGPAAAPVARLFQPVEDVQRALDPADLLQPGRAGSGAGKRRVS